MSPFGTFPTSRDVRMKSGMRAKADVRDCANRAHRPSFLMQIGWPLGTGVQSQSGPKPLFGLEFGNQ
jgi:hypothetical protein